MTRYELADFDSGNEWMRESPDGDWVRFEDVPQWPLLRDAAENARRVLAIAASYETDADTIGLKIHARDCRLAVERLDEAIARVALPPSPTPPRGETP